MDTCHECVNIVEKLNEEFSELQDEYDILRKDFDYYKDYHSIMSKLSKYFYYNEYPDDTEELIKNIDNLDSNLKDKCLKIVMEQIIGNDNEHTKMWNEKELMDYFRSRNMNGDIDKCYEDYKVVYEDYENYGYSDLFIYKLPWDKTKYIIEDYR
tara:strand:- start:19 stop:480 length:462 start_codon:yes stop_codon:yes gene_type:complete